MSFHYPPPLHQVDCNACEHGRCTPNGRCVCEPGYTGHACTIEEGAITDGTTSAPPLESWVIILAAVLGTLLLVVVVVVWRCRARCFGGDTQHQGGGGAKYGEVTPGGQQQPYQTMNYQQAPHDKLYTPDYHAGYHGNYGPGGGYNMLEMAELAASTETLDYEIKV